MPEVTIKNIEHKSCGSSLAGILPGYAQGGVAVDRIGYFVSGSRSLSNSDAYPNIAAFNLKTMRLIRAYDFDHLGDSTPLVIPKKNSDWLVIGHENRKSRTAALYRDSGEPAWTSAANQPGSAFFGFSYFKRNNGTTLLLARADDGLHAISAEDGREVWHVKRRGGMTPAVDQVAGVIYFQSCGCLDKIRAATGRVIKSIKVTADPRAKGGGEPALCNSGNTLLVKDNHGSYIATCWNNQRFFSSTVRVFDTNLKPVWQTDWRLMSKKATLCYHAGILFTGCGDSWTVRDYQRLPDNNWKQVCAFKIDSGRAVWECDLSKYPILDIQGVIYCQGLIIAQTTWLGPYRVFLIDAASGTLRDVLKPIGNRWASSCAQPMFTGGCLFNGDYNANAVLATPIGKGELTDWPGAFGDPQLHHMAAPDSALSGGKIADRYTVRLQGDYRKTRQAGKVKYRQKLYARARADFIRAFNLGGQQAAPSAFLRECELMIGHTFFYEKKYEDAKSVYRRILLMEEISPRISGMAQLYLAHAWRMQGNLSAAANEYAKIADMPGIPVKWVWAAAEAGHRFLRAHEYDKARRAYLNTYKLVQGVPADLKRRAVRSEVEIIEV